MLEKILDTLPRKTKKIRAKPGVKKGFHFFENKKQSLFKKRKKNLFSGSGNNFLNSIKKQKKLPLIIGITGIIIITLLFFICSSFLKISNIYVYREDSIINIDQAYGNIDYIRGQNILLLDTNEIASRLQKSQTSISSIEFDVDFPNIINIHIGSHPALFQTDTHLILSNGVIVSKYSKEYIGIPYIKTSENIEDYAIFGNTLNINDLKNLNILINQGKKNILGFDFTKIKYYIKEKELLVMHTSGSIFIFDLAHDVISQIEKLAIYDKEKGYIFDKKYIYVDTRIPEKLFLCPLEFEYDCRRNMKLIYGKTIFEEFELTSFEPQQ